MQRQFANPNELGHLTALFLSGRAARSGGAINRKMSVKSLHRSDPAMAAFRVEQIDHVELFVPDRREAAAWYGRTFGLHRAAG